MKAFTLSDFKTLLQTDSSFKNDIISKNDIINFDNGTMTIYRQNINKYLEKYMCKDEADLEDTLWFNYGVFVTILD